MVLPPSVRLTSVKSARNRSQALIFQRMVSLIGGVPATLNVRVDGGDDLPGLKYRRCGGVQLLGDEAPIDV